MVTFFDSLIADGAFFTVCAVRLGAGLYCDTYSTYGPPMFPLKISIFSANPSIVASVLPLTMT
jgi:hypothetical protein